MQKQQPAALQRKARQPGWRPNAQTDRWLPTPPAAPPARQPRWQSLSRTRGWAFASIAQTEGARVCSGSTIEPVELSSFVRSNAPPFALAAGPIMAGDPSMLRLLIATDNHIGVHEEDPIRKDDSFTAFEEILAHAVRTKVDALLLGGDIFHENKPSRCVANGGVCRGGQRVMMLRLARAQAHGCAHHRAAAQVLHERQPGALSGGVRPGSQLLTVRVPLRLCLRPDSPRARPAATHASTTRTRTTTWACRSL